ncbi:hypothetical protein PCANC_22739 [Puccinia coronata f. sp. avenae]|uniref:Uncharacterized protein n=1 Tax=Puccinia coronata f. sp. avenae TaxID=200324 RepID=A0A2N5U9P8_9BASI|nr:hypothetical protein PCANC_22739 [Puccinia coronata f. sp. avenae]
MKVPPLRLRKHHDHTMMWHSLVLTTVIADYEPGDQPHQLAFLMWEASFFKEKFG